jgi:uncharacterized integral membrane protein
MIYVTGGLAALLLLLVVAFAVQNLAGVDVAFLFWSVNVPKILLILGTYFLGMISGWGLIELVKRLGS